ncbi:hypothetical protein EVAR_86857_1 [Eumeta japonica]|uniref:Uncharacterized protein n=1 Tax=Eumeta variegata TaxID=151549 RepID=A0A4C1VVK9_EUMVA|nr:hypothetical protein EVAR_86857_1 [Eumeta japonica]
MTAPENLMRGIESEDAEMIDEPIVYAKEEEEQSVDFNASLDLVDIKNNINPEDERVNYRREVNLTAEPQQRRIETTTEVYAEESPTTFLDANEEIVERLEAAKKKQVEMNDQKNTKTSIYPTTATESYENGDDRQRETHEDNNTSNYIDTTASKNEMKVSL